MILLTEEHRQRYQRDGFLLLRQVLSEEKIDELENRFLSLVNEWSRCDIKSTNSEELAELLLSNRELERKLYDGIRQYPWLIEFAKAIELTSPVTELFAEAAGLMRKILFRIDLPGVIREMAVWHQDYHYVRGNEKIISTWAPLNDTNYARGCLMVMPGSHHLGILDHDIEVLGKRHFPSGIFGREVRYVEMQRGDLLLFHSLLLHSSGFNLSSVPRLSIQARYSAQSSPTDLAMGDVIPV